MGELIDKLKGKIKQVEGKVTNDPGLEAEGKLDELKGNVKGAFEEVKSGVKKALRSNDNASTPVKP